MPSQCSNPATLTFDRGLWLYLFVVTTTEIEIYVAEECILRFPRDSDARESADYTPPETFRHWD